MSANFHLFVMEAPPAGGLEYYTMIFHPSEEKILHVLIFQPWAPEGDSKLSNHLTLA